MSCCLQILTLTAGIESPPLESLPNCSKTWAGWGAVPTWGRGKAKTSLSSGTTAPGSEHKRLPKVRNVPSLSENRFSTGVGPLRRREAHPVWQPRHFGATCLFTPAHTCWHTCRARGFEQVRKGKGPRVGINKAAKLTCCIAAGAWGVSLCPKDKWKMHTCSATADMGCIHMPDSDWHWLSRVEVIWHQKRTWGAKSSQILWSLFAFIPMSKEKHPKIDNNSLKTSFSLYYLHWVTDNSATAGNWISKSVLHIFPTIY